MNIERIILAMAGFFILGSVILAVNHDLNWLWFTGFVGVNLFQSSFTGFCPMAKVLSFAGKKSGSAFK